MWSKSNLKLSHNKVSPKLLSGFPTRQTPGGDRKRFDDRQENSAGPSRSRRHSRSNQGFRNGEPIRQPQCTLPQPLDKVGGNAIAETGLDETTGEEKGDDDEPDDFIGEGAERGGEREGFGDDRGGDTEESPGADGERTKDETRDGGEENGEELPCLGG